MQKKEEANWSDFQKIDFRVGTILQADNFTKAIKPAYILHIDLGEEYGICKSSAQITEHYDLQTLVGKQVVCVCNLPSKQIGSILSQVLVTGFPDKQGNVVLCVPDQKTPNGARLF